MHGRPLASSTPTLHPRPRPDPPEQGATRSTTPVEPGAPTRSPSPAPTGADRTSPASADDGAPGPAGTARRPGALRRLGRRGLSRPLRLVLFESFLVVFGVVLAFGANEWREHRNRVAHAELALANIHEELRVNRDEVRRALAYHSQLRDTLYAIAHRAAEARARGEAEPYPDFAVFHSGFIAPARLLSTAWDAARETAALGDMRYDDVLAAARMYARQAQYTEQARTVGEVIYGEMLRIGMPGMVRNYVNLTAIISAFAYREQQLLEAYAELLHEDEP